MVAEETKQTELEILRHSCAHVMAQAIKFCFPQAKLGTGPAVENGFYYDVHLDKALDERDLAKIEQKMRELVKANHPFVKKILKRGEAERLFKGMNETFKLEIIEGLAPEEEISIYTNGDFTDLCRGPHVRSTGEIGAFKLTNVAGAYWRGDERNAVMQRVYGTAFGSQKDLESFLKAREEAKLRDHRKLGTELDFFSFQEDAGQGLVFFHPKGALLRHLIEQYIKEEHLKRSYSFVMGPQILKSDVWKISGHYYYYKENMFMFETEDKKEYAVKPMNCPAHILIFKTSVRSYRELPLRFFEMGNVCRNEKSGVLHGLLRVRNFTQDDAHIFCAPDQLEAEIAQVIDLAFEVLQTFGFHEYEIELSTRPQESKGTDQMWESATAALKGALERKKLAYQVAPGGGAFYGPKIDIRIKDALGRPWQCSTIQCDFALPEAFGLEYIAPSGKKERPVMLHRAILGSVERFMGCLIEHYAGALPFWLSPMQVAVIPVAQAHEAPALELKHTLEKENIRVVCYDSSETLNRRIRKAQNEKIPRTLVIGDREVASQTVSVRRLGSPESTTMHQQAFIEQSLAERRART